MGEGAARTGVQPVSLTTLVTFELEPRGHEIG